MTAIHRYARIPAVLTLVFVMGGQSACSMLLGGGSPPTDRYTINSGATAHANSPAGNQAGDRIADTPRYMSSGYTLDLRPVSAPEWLDSRRMLYRLDYDNNAELAAYTRSAWADTPAQLVADNLDEALSSSNLFAAVLGDTPGQADLALQIELSDFSQHFASATNSRGRIMVKATLLRADNGRVIAQKRFDTSAMASSADAGGGVKALAAADSQLNAAIQSWLADVISHCDKTCPKPGKS